MTRNRSPSGGDDWPAASLPQQKGVPSKSNPHVWLSPLLTDSTWSDPTGIDCPWSLLPQQTGGPVGDTRQVCRPPLLMNDGICITNCSSGCGVSIPGPSGVGVAVGSGTGVGVAVGSGIGVAVGSGTGVAVGAGAGVGVGVVGPSGVARDSNCTSAGCCSPHAASVSSTSAIARERVK